MYFKTELAYAAGILDGEGCICLRSNGSWRARDYYLADVNITNTDKRLIDWLHDNFGGGIIQKKVTGNRKPCWRWQLYGKKAADFLDLMLPYLIVKKAQAELAISFIKRQQGRRGQRWRIDNKEAVIIENDVTLMKRLNMQGRGSP